MCLVLVSDATLGSIVVFHRVLGGLEPMQRGSNDYRARDPGMMAE